MPTLTLPFHHTPHNPQVIGYAGFVLKGMLEVADEYNSVYVDDVDRE